MLDTNELEKSTKKNQDAIAESYAQAKKDTELQRDQFEKLHNIASYLRGIGSSMHHMGNVHGEKLMRSADNMDACVETLRNIGYRETQREFELTQIQSANMLNGMLTGIELARQEKEKKNAVS